MICEKSLLCTCFINKFNALFFIDYVCKGLGVTDVKY